MKIENLRIVKSAMLLGPLWFCAVILCWSLYAWLFTEFLGRERTCGAQRTLCLAGQVRRICPSGTCICSFCLCSTTNHQLENFPNGRFYSFRFNRAGDHCCRDLSHRYSREKGQLLRDGARHCRDHPPGFDVHHPIGRCFYWLFTASLEKF